MAFNELEAMKMIDDGKLSDDEIKLLTRVRQGIVATEFTKEDADSKDAKAFEELEKKGLLTRTALSAPRTSAQVDVVIPSEAGLTVLNLFDKRYRENANGQRDELTAPNADPEIVRAPTDDQKVKVPSLEAEPLSADKKNLGSAPDADKEAMKDPLVRVGARDPSNAELSAETVVTDKAKVVIPEDSSVGVQSSVDGKTRTTETRKKD